MMKMTNKVLASSLVILAALGLAGCTNSAAAPTKTSTSATKVSQQTSKKAASSTSSEKAKDQTSTSTPTNVQSTSSTNTSSTSCCPLMHWSRVIRYGKSCTRLFTAKQMSSMKRQRGQLLMARLKSSVTMVLLQIMLLKG